LHGAQGSAPPSCWERRREALELLVVLRRT
jgi:hypothetical protein